MFGAKYSRLKFWIISLSLLIPGMFIAGLAKVLRDTEHADTSGILYIISFLISLIWINTLANRIRDYGSNPWIALFALLPIVNIVLALYYGIKQYKTVNNTENNDISLTKAVYNHAKDLSNEIKPAINEYKEKHITSNFTPSSTTSNNISNNLNISGNIVTLDENEIYEKIMLEIEEDKKVKSTWAKALAQSDGNKDKAESLYINMRFEELKYEQSYHKEELNLNEEVKEIKTENEVETKKESSSKTIVFLIILISACIISLLTYFYLNKDATTIISSSIQSDNTSIQNNTNVQKDISMSNKDINNSSSDNLKDLCIKKGGLNSWDFKKDIASCKFDYVFIDYKDLHLYSKDDIKKEKDSQLDNYLKDLCINKGGINSLNIKNNIASCKFDNIFIEYKNLHLYSNEDIYQQNINIRIKKFISAIKSRDKNLISNYINYPFFLQTSIPPIRNKEEFIEKFDLLFDDYLLNEIVNKPEEWQRMGTKGIIFKDGDLWLDIDGSKIISINYKTKKQENLKQLLITKEKDLIHQSLKDYSKPLFEVYTDKYRIRVDYLENRKYRYAAWNIDNNISDKPNIILTNGTIEYNGNGGTYSLYFSNGEYKYVIENNQAFSIKSYLKVFKNDKLLLDTELKFD